MQHVHMSGVNGAASHERGTYKALGSLAGSMSLKPLLSHAQAWCRRSPRSFCHNERNCHTGEWLVQGTKRVNRLEENVTAFQIKLTRADLDELDAAFPHDVALGDRCETD